MRKQRAPLMAALCILMPSPALTDWEPVAPSKLQFHLGAFANWCICGGLSVDLLAGEQTRSHGDIDIGVYRSDIVECLSSLVEGIPYLCDPPGNVVAWDGKEVPGRVNDVWIASNDNSKWIIQVLIFSDIEDRVIFKRDQSVAWSKASHTIMCAGYRILNPAITLLYKSTSRAISEKDAMDIATLIDCYRNQPDA